MAIGYRPSSFCPGNITDTPHFGAWIPPVHHFSPFLPVVSTLLFPFPPITRAWKNHSAFFKLASGLSVTRENCTLTDSCDL